MERRASQGPRCRRSSVGSRPSSAISPPMGEMVAARGEGRGAAWCHLLVASDGLGGPPQRKAVGEMLYFRGRCFTSRGERGCSWPWPCWVNQLPIVASISKKSSPDPRGGGELTERPGSHPGDQLRGGRGERREILREAACPMRSSHES